MAGTPLYLGLVGSVGNCSWKIVCWSNELISLAAGKLRCEVEHPIKMVASFLLSSRDGNLVVGAGAGQGPAGESNQTHFLHFLFVYFLHIIPIFPFRT
jgi:hypothetical protein